MARYQVVCITKHGGHLNPTERITHLGISTIAGTEVHSQAQVIAWIEGRVHAFYVDRGGTPVEVIVATNNGRKYLKTVADHLEPNNLLSLRDC